MILIRRYYSNSKYAETEAQAKKRESDAAKLVLSTGGLGAALAARKTFKVGGDKLSKKVTNAVTKDAITLDKINEVVDKINTRGVKPEDVEKAKKFLNESVKNRFNHNVSATKKKCQSMDLKSLQKHQVRVPSRVLQ